MGTRVKIRVEGAGEYMALLKDYNKDHLSFMNVKDKDNKGYRDQWGYEPRIQTQYQQFQQT